MYLLLPGAYRAREVGEGACNAHSTTYTNRNPNMATNLYLEVSLICDVADVYTYMKRPNSKADQRTAVFLYTRHTFHRLLRPWG